VERALEREAGHVHTGIENMTAALYRLATREDGKDGRSQVMAFKAVMEAGDWSHQPAEAPVPTGGAALYLSSGAVDQILELARRGLERDNG
jgi:hypothetical protein